MKTCPVCHGPWLSKAQYCPFCKYEAQKPASEPPAKEADDPMAPYKYSVTADGGYRIITVKNVRDVALRGRVSLPSRVTEIADGAFACCKFMSVIELPNGLVSIGENAFGGCRDLFDVFIPETVTTVGKAAFADCESLANIRLAAPALPPLWDADWLEGCHAKVTLGCDA